MQIIRFLANDVPVALHAGELWLGLVPPPDLTFHIREAIKIGEDGDVGVQIAHVKVGGRENWGKIDNVLRLIDDARARGVDVSGDVYPYHAGSTKMDNLLPSWVHDGGLPKLLERLADRPTRRKIVEECLVDGETPETLEAELGKLDAALAASPYLAGSQFTLADVAYVPWIVRAETRAGIDLGEHESLRAWLARLTQRRSIAAELEVVATTAT